jgi:hypothetical protein
MLRFTVGAGKAAFMSVTEVIVVAEADMVMFSCAVVDFLLFC